VKETEGYRSEGERKKSRSFWKGRTETREGKKMLASLLLASTAVAGMRRIRKEEGGGEREQNRL